MAFKDDENLDVTKETTEEELERLGKKYKVGNDKVGVRRTLICLGIAIILTVFIMLLYSNIIVIDFIAKMSFSMVYFVLFFLIVSEIYIILIKRRNIKEDIWLLISMIAILISITTFIIGVMAPISSILKAILLITTMITFILFILLMVGGKILGIESK